MYISVLVLESAISLRSSSPSSGDKFRNQDLGVQCVLLLGLVASDPLS